MPRTIIPNPDRWSVYFSFDSLFTNGAPAHVTWSAHVILPPPGERATDWPWLLDCAAEALRVGAQNDYGDIEVGWSSERSGRAAGNSIGERYRAALLALTGRQWDFYNRCHIQAVSRELGVIWTRGKRKAA